MSAKSDAEMILQLWGIERSKGGGWRQGKTIADTPEEAAQLFTKRREATFRCETCNHYWGYHSAGPCCVNHCPCQTYTPLQEFA